MPLNPTNINGIITFIEYNPFVIYIPYSVYQFIEGEVNVQLQIAVNSPATPPVNTYNILAATDIHLTITEPNGTVTRVLPMTSDPTGLLAIRNLLAIDFAYAGNYTCQLEAVFSDGTTIKSATQAIIVGA